MTNYERLFNLSIDLLCIAGFDGFLKKLNTSWEKILGFSKNELLLKPLIAFIHPEDIKSTIHIKDRFKKVEYILNFQNRYLCKDG